MRKSQVFVGVLLMVAAVLAVGCAKPPQMEIDAAKAALTAAEQAEAPKYAAEAWDKGQQGMNAVNAELEAQNAKFALFRSYTKAKQLIADATTAANAAKDAGIAGKEKAKNDAMAAIDAAKAALTAADGLFAAIGKCPRARGAKEVKKDLGTVKGNMDAMKAQVADIDAKFAKEDFFGAKAAADTLKGQVDPVAKDLEGIKTKFKCK
ncbi:MAG: hypothetical protein MUO25_12210 [Thermoanaerobaculaceae bacterium]|jgi:hypothetical protein|nr:hypothetical protein [Thermoanaerobaculaceae bacterium]